MAYELSELVNRAAFMSTEAQIVLEDLVEDLPWQAELGSDNPSLTWGEGDDAIVTRPSLLGTVAVQEMTWHWAWDNINGFPAAVVRRAEEVKARADGTHALTEVELPIEANRNLPLELTLAAKALTGVWTHYAASAGPGTDVWFLLESPKLALGEPSVVRIGRVIAQALMSITVSDHRAALLEYAKLRGISHREGEDTVTLLAADGSATVMFSAGRIVNIEATSRTEDEAEPTREVPPMASAVDEAPVAAEAPRSEPVAPQAPAESEEPAEASEDRAAEVSGLEVAPEEQVAEERPVAEERKDVEDAEVVGAEVFEEDAEAAQSGASADSSLERGPEEERVAEAQSHAAREADRQDVEEPAERLAPEAPVREERVREEEDKPEKKKGFFSRLFGGR